MLLINKTIEKHFESTALAGKLNEDLQTSLVSNTKVTIKQTSCHVIALKIKQQQTLT